ncbi:MAG: hypothetical protein IH977_15290 [Nitrospinae bacterium]|nr:hypothetical protein [Nitrospinota bacterium]
MTNDTQQEIDQLRALATPYRFRVILNQDGEAVIPGQYGQVEWVSYSGKTLVAHTEKKRILHKLLNLPWTVPHQVGGEEGSVTFPSTRLGEIGVLLRLRRHRNPATSSHLLKFQFPPRHKDLETGVNLSPSLVAG